MINSVVNKNIGWEHIMNKDLTLSGMCQKGFQKILNIYNLLSSLKTSGVSGSEAAYTIYN